MSAAARSYRVPGRIEFLGKHTDYAGGRSLVCATERGITLHVTPRAHARGPPTRPAGGDTLGTRAPPARARPARPWGDHYNPVG